MRNRWLVAFTLLALAPLDQPSAQQPAGRYEGTLVFRPLADGRLFQLTEPFGYVDADGRNWAVPPGTRVDGASIPRALWSVFGAPFTGKYRAAAVIHDHYCDVKVYSSEETHRAFYEAMLTSGEESRRAKLMYFAVLRFGPRWSVEANPYYSSGRASERRVRVALPFDKADFAEFRGKLDKGDVPLDEIEREAIKRREGLDRVGCVEAVSRKYAHSVRCRTQRKRP